MNFLDKYFKISESGSKISTEILGGITIFLSMSYILAVMPFMFSEVGMDQGAVFTATALSAFFATLLMGLFANSPIGLAPGMGMNAFFTYTMVIEMGYTWEQALFAIFVSGLIFIIISISGLRRIVINMIPISIKYAVTVGIGFFIAFIGMQNAGIIVASDATLVTIGNLQSPTTILAIIGTIFTLILIARKVNLAIFFGMVLVIILSLIFFFLGVDVGIEALPTNIVSKPASIAPTFGKFFSVDYIKLLLNLNFWILILSVLFVDFFDTAGTILAVGNEAGTIDKDGNIKNSSRILLVDSIGTTVGAVLGVSSVTSYIESLTGIRLGARTGLAAVVTAFCFLLAIFFSPLLVLITSSVTAPALITIGALMVSNNAKIEYENIVVAISSFVTVAFIVLTYSISNGLAAGIIVYTMLKLFTGKYKELNPLMYGLSIIFVLYFIFLN